MDTLWLIGGGLLVALVGGWPGYLLGRRAGRREPRPVERLVLPPNRVMSKCGTAVRVRLQDDVLAHNKTRRGTR